MTNIEILISGARAELVDMEGILTSGMVGANAYFTFDGEWDGLAKTACFRAGRVSRDVYNIDNTCEVPPEVLMRSGPYLEIGVYGCNADNGYVVIPTVWVKVGPIQSGADPSGSPAAKPTPGAVEQMMTLAEASKKAAEEALKAAQAAGPAAQRAEEAAQKTEQAAVDAEQTFQQIRQTADEVAANRQATEQAAGTAAGAANAATEAARQAAADKQSVEQSVQAAETAAKRSEDAAASVADNTTQAKKAAEEAKAAAEQASKEAEQVAAKAEDLITAKVEEAVSQRTPVAILDITIPAEGWSADDADEEYPLYIDVPCDIARAVHYPDVTLHRTSLTTAMVAGLCPAASAMNGAIRFWAQAQPTADMTATVALLTASSGTPGSGGTITGDIASDEEVDEVLEEVFDQDNVASDTEVKEVVQDIFGENAVNE